MNLSFTARRTEGEPKSSIGSAPENPGERATAFSAERLKGHFQRLSLFQKTMLANSAVVLLGAIAGTYITQWLVEEHSALLLILLFFTSGAVITILVNYLAFWGHFKPLLDLSQALEAIRSGQQARREISDVRAADTGNLISSVMTLINHIEDHSLNVTARLLGSIESERQRIGRELHDDTSQIIAAALLSLGLAERQLQGDPETAHRSLDSARELMQLSLDQLKTVIYDLRPVQLDELGIASALRWYIKARVQRPGLEVIAHFEDGAYRLPPPVETALYRIGQEALANCVKHANARRVEVALEVKPGYAVLSVFDNGKGFHPSQAQHRGLGLVSMRERIGLLNGQFNVVSEPGSGTRIYALVPLQTVENKESADL